MRCSSNCVWACCRSAPDEFELECGVRLRVWNTGKRRHCLVCCRRGRRDGLPRCERDRTAVADDGPASPGNWTLAGAATTGPRSVLWWCCQVSSDLVTPFWTGTDNPTPFAVSDQITPPDTDWLSVLMCRERTGPSWYCCGFLDAFLLMCLLAECRCWVNEWLILWLKPWPFYMVFLLFICPSIGRLISTKVLTQELWWKTALVSGVVSRDWRL